MRKKLLLLVPVLAAAVLTAGACAGGGSGGTAASEPQTAVQSDMESAAQTETKSGTQTDAGAEVQSEEESGAWPASALPARFGEIVRLKENEDSEPDILLSGDQEWKYLDDPELLSGISGHDWTEEGYDDSAWRSGSGSFGALRGEQEKVGSCYPVTLLEQYSDGEENIPVFYFRTEFEADSGESAGVWIADIIYDDAVIVYLNGEPVYYGNTPEDGFDEDGFGCKNALSEPWHKGFVLDFGLLREGKNILAVELHQKNSNSSDIYFELKSLDSGSAWLGEIRDESLCLGVGAVPGEMLVTWQGYGALGYVEVAEAAEAKDGFPEDAALFPAERVYMNDWDTDTFRAVMTGLKPDCDYVYRVADSTLSDTYTFTTPADGDFSFLVNGDPQIEESNDEESMEIYDRILEAAAQGRNPAFILSLGDQSDNRENEDIFLRYLSTDWSTRVPIAAIVGNHEDASDTFSRFFYMPQVDPATVGDSGDMSGDYWFFRDGTLFLCLNSNNSDYENHAKFLRGAKEVCTARFGEPKWIVAAFHHSIYSVGSHANADNILRRRQAFAPVLEEIGADLVLMGHDHTYTRTVPIGGVVYITLGSSTGTKYYELSDGSFDYALIGRQDGCPCAGRIDVSGDGLVFTYYGLKEDGTIEVMDECTIR